MAATIFLWRSHSARKSCDLDCKENSKTNDPVVKEGGTFTDLSVKVDGPSYLSLDDNMRDGVHEYSTINKGNCARNETVLNDYLANQGKKQNDITSPINQRFSRDNNAPNIDKVAQSQQYAEVSERRRYGYNAAQTRSEHSFSVDQSDPLKAGGNLDADEKSEDISVALTCSEYCVPVQQSDSLQAKGNQLYVNVDKKSKEISAAPTCSKHSIPVQQAKGNQLYVNVNKKTEEVSVAPSSLEYSMTAQQSAHLQPKGNQLYVNVDEKSKEVSVAPTTCSPVCSEHLTPADEICPTCTEEGKLYANVHKSKEVSVARTHTPTYSAHSMPTDDINPSRAKEDQLYVNAGVRPLQTKGAQLYVNIDNKGKVVSVASTCSEHLMPADQIDSPCAKENGQFYVNVDKKRKVCDLAT